MAKALFFPATGISKHQEALTQEKKNGETSDG